jgi:hypothetical protein
VGLSAIRAAAAAVGGFSHLAVLINVADEYLAAHAGVGAQALEAGVMGLYGVVIVAGLRYSVGVHRGFSLWAGLREMCRLRGAIPLSDALSLPLVLPNVNLCCIIFA